jgi:hypothetical protein
MIWSMHTKAAPVDVAIKFAQEHFSAPVLLQSLDTELNSPFGYRGNFRFSGCGRIYKLLGSFPGICSVSLS